MGMAPLAVYLAQAGNEVSGEDDATREEVWPVLTRSGVLIGSIPERCDLVVCSSAIKADHPSLRLARERGCRIVKRGEMLAEISKGKKLVAVCGSHGKTTTTAMLVEALRRLNFSADYVLGGLFADPSVAPAMCVGSDWLIAEVDESDGTIRKFSPEITLVVNLDWDHTNHYRDPAEMRDTFSELLARTTGRVLTSRQCEMSGSLNPSHRHALTFGQGGDYDYELTGEESNLIKLKLSGAFNLHAAQVRGYGDFNAHNAVGALATAQLMGAILREDALRNFIGVRRRQTVLCQIGGIQVIEDYAHHPNEVAALLTALRKQLPPKGRLITVFQPHRYSRTAQFKKEFALALQPADKVFLMDVYGAGEDPVVGGTSRDILTECERETPTLSVRLVGADLENFFGQLENEVQAGDRVAFVGAGSIGQLVRKWTTRWVGKHWDDLGAVLRSQLSESTVLKREESLAKKTTMRVGGAARLYAEPASRDDLSILLRGARSQGVAVYFLGRGSNLIITDEGVDGLVIALSKPQWAEFSVEEGGRVRVGAGLRLKNLCGLAAKAGLVGFEFLEGIPGNVGGALRMNAGAMGGWMFDVVEEVELMQLDGTIRHVKKAEMRVVYRCCEELLDAIALGAILRPAASADAETVGRQIDVYRRKRQESQPREPSAGCIFKNPENGSAGQLIDQAGLKGTRVGGAEVSPVHGNFIVNRAGATGSDVVDLVRKVRSEILRSTGIALEPEAQLWGKRWEDVL